MAQYRATIESSGRRVQAVSGPRLFATDHGPPPPFLPEMAELEWRPG